MQVIGSSMKKKFKVENGRWVLTRPGKLNSFNDKEVKPVNIDQHIGRKPLLAAGNVHSGDDIAMLLFASLCAEGIQPT
jgi:hypothetical protein